MSRRIGRKARLIGTALVVFALSGGAAAFLTSAGAGDSTASVGTISALTITPGTPEAQLYPGGTGDVVATITNPNAFAVRVDSLALDSSRGAGGFAVDAAHAGCDTSVLGYATQTNGGGGWTIPAKAGSTDGALDVRLANALTMGSAAGTACQGAVFTVYLRPGG